MYFLCYFIKLMPSNHLITVELQFSSLRLKHIPPHHSHTSCKRQKTLYVVISFLQSVMDMKQKTRSQCHIKLFKKKFLVFNFSMKILKMNCPSNSLLSSVQSLRHVRLFETHEPQYARPPCPSSTPGVYPNSCPLSR